MHVAVFLATVVLPPALLVAALTSVSVYSMLFMLLFGAACAFPPFLSRRKTLSVVALSWTSLALSMSSLLGQLVWNASGGRVGAQGSLAAKAFGFVRLTQISALSAVGHVLPHGVLFIVALAVALLGSRRITEASAARPYAASYPFPLWRGFLCVLSMTAAAMFVPSILASAYLVALLVVIIGLAVCKRPLAWLLRLVGRPLLVFMACHCVITYICLLDGVWQRTERRAKLFGLLVPSDFHSWSNWPQIVSHGTAVLLFFFLATPTTHTHSSSSTPVTQRMIDKGDPWRNTKAYIRAAVDPHGWKSSTATVLSNLSLKIFDKQQAGGALSVEFLVLFVWSVIARIIWHWDNIQPSEPGKMQRFKERVTLLRGTAKDGIMLFLFVIVQYSYILSLIGLYFACLTGASVLNAGYSSDKYAHFSGLIHYDQEPQPKAVWLGMIWEIVIAVFVTVQWHVERLFGRSIFSPPPDQRHRRATIELRGKFLQIQMSEGMNMINKLGSTLAKWFKSFGVVFCYGSLLLAGLLAPLSAVSLIYLLILNICLLFHCHLRHGKSVVKRIWVFFVFLEALILLACYAYQFDLFNEWLDRLYKETSMSKKITMRELGMIAYHKELFFGLLPNVAVLVFSILQLRSFISKSEPKPVVYVEDISIFHIIILVLLLLSQFFPKGVDLICGPILWTCQVFFFAILVYNFSGFDDYGSNYSALLWLGLKRDYDSANAIKVHTETWGMVREYIAIVILVMIQRMSFYYESGKLQDKSNAREKIFLFPAPKDYGLKTEIAFVLLCIALFTHFRNILGVLYFVSLLIGLSVERKHTRRLAYFLMALLSIYLLLDDSRISTYILDLLVIFSMSSIFFMPRDTVDIYEVIKVPQEDKAFPNKPRSVSNWIRYVIFRSYALVMLLCLVTAGAYQDILSMCYVTYALVMLYLADFLYVHKKRWNAMRYLNYVIISLQLAFQVAYVLVVQFSIQRVDRHLETMEKISTVIGLRWVDANDSEIAKSNLFFAIVVLVLFAIQRTMTTVLRRELSMVRAHVSENETRAYEKARELMGAGANDTIDEINRLLEEKRMRRERLNMLREERRRSFAILAERAEQAVLDDEEDEEPAAEEPEKEKRPLKQKIADFMRTILWLLKHFFLYCVDKSIILLHGSVVTAEKKRILEEFIRRTQEEQEKEIAAKEHKLTPAVTRRFRPSSKGSDRQEQEGSSSPSIPIVVVKPDDGLAPSPEDPKSECIDAGLDNQVEGALAGTAAAAALLDISSSEASLVSEAAPPGPKYPSRKHLLIKGILAFSMSSTHVICMLAMLVNHFIEGSLISLVYVICSLAYAVMCRRPRPMKFFWNMILGYTTALICIKYLIQIPGFCTCESQDGVYWSFDPKTILDVQDGGTCSSAKCNSYIGDPIFNAPVLIGIKTTLRPFFVTVLPDLLVLLAVLLHKHQMLEQGYWDSHMQVAARDERRRIANYRTMKEMEFSVLYEPESISSEHDHEDLGKRVAIRSVRQQQGHLTLNKGDVITVMKKGLTKATWIGMIGANYKMDDDKTQDVATMALPTPRKNNDSISDVPEAIIETSKGLASHFRKIGRSIKKYYRHLLFDTTRFHSDYYTAIFLSDFGCFLYLVIFGGELTGVKGMISEYVQQSYIPRQYVALLVFHFLVIVADRITYICKSIIGKLVLQYFTLVVYNSLMLWYFPSVMGVSFVNSGKLRVLFLIKCIYWVLSGLQIRDGYPVILGDRFLMRGYSTLHNLCFIAYRSIPFVYELRSVSDWTFSKTTLNFWMYLKVEDVYAELFSVKCNVESMKNDKRKRGQPVKMKDKALLGCLFFTALCVVIWLPLLLLSSAAPGVDVTFVDRATTTVGFVGWKPLYEQSLSEKVGISKLSGSSFDYIRATWGFMSTDDKHRTQNFTFPVFSESVWGITDNSLESLKSTLPDTDVPILIQAVTIFHRPSESSDVPSDMEFATEARQLTAEERTEFARVLTEGNGATITMRKLLPRFLRLPGTTGSVQSVHSATTIDCAFRYWGNANKSGKASSNYWDFYQLPINETDDEYIFNTQGIQQIAVETPVPRGLAGVVANVGVIGLYATVVLTVARFVRGIVSGLSHVIMFENLPNPDPLLQLCTDILMARQDEDLMLEELLSTATTMEGAVQQALQAFSARLEHMEQTMNRRSAEETTGSRTEGVLQKTNDVMPQTLANDPAFVLSTYLNGKALVDAQEAAPTTSRPRAQPAPEVRV
eukprot:m51a1_g5968 hypothetical protein (2224) ;mRNA; f:181542-200918